MTPFEQFILEVLKTVAGMVIVVAPVAGLFLRVVLRRLKSLEATTESTNRKAARIETSMNTPDPTRPEERPLITHVGPAPK